MLLLQDEQPDVRDEAARFASLLPRDGAALLPRDGAALAENHDASTLHSTKGLQVRDWFTCGSAVAQWIRQQTFNNEVSGSNLLSAAVVQGILSSLPSPSDGT